MKKFIMAVILLGLLISCGGVAQAQDTMINACVNQNGLTFIVSSLLECGSNETGVSWPQQTFTPKQERFYTVRKQLNSPVLVTLDEYGYWTEALPPKPACDCYPGLEIKTTGGGDLSITCEPGDQAQWATFGASYSETQLNASGKFLMSTSESFKEIYPFLPIIDADNHLIGFRSGFITTSIVYWRSQYDFIIYNTRFGGELVCIDLTP